MIIDNSVNRNTFFSELSIWKIPKTNALIKGIIHNWYW